MNKNIKRIIALALAFGTISAVAPTTSLFTTKAYAADAENDDDELSSLELETGSGTNIKLYEDDDYDDKVDSVIYQKNEVAEVKKFQKYDVAVK